MATTGIRRASARNWPGGITSSATSSPSTLPDSDLIRRWNGSPAGPNVSSSEQSVPRSTDSTACTSSSMNRGLVFSMPTSVTPRSRAARPMMSLRRRLRPWAEPSGT